jgi:peptide-methionine (R)-S-oxide reductase
MSDDPRHDDRAPHDVLDPSALSDADWRERLGDQAYRVLRHEATERPGSSPLNHEWRAGHYVCAACGHPLFRSDVKFDAHCGWPSFSEALPGAFETKTDHHIGYARTEYHCANCGGHHGHVFDDGPAPTGVRYCSNGVALRFVPDGNGSGVDGPDDPAR